MTRNIGLWNCFKNILYKKIVIDQINYTLEAFILILHFRIFLKTYNFIKKTQWWSKEKLEKYQLKQLKKLLVHTYENVPYYRKLFDKIDFNPKDFKDFEDLQKIPFLTKEIIRKNFEDFKASNYPDYKFGYMTTGGTSGVPLGIYEEKNVSYVKELAYLKIFLEWNGLNFFDKSLTLRGAIVPGSEKGKFWKYSLFHRSLILSSYHMTSENLPKYIKKIRRFKPKYIIAYPSSLCILAKFMKINKIKPFKSLKIIICGAETLYDWQRISLENIYKCRIIEAYGHAEQAVIAYTCEKSNYFHFFPVYGYVEFIGKNGKPVKKENENCEIVATGFKNEIFPLIRYKTDDSCVYTSKKCSCRRNHPLAKKIEGRWSSSDFLVSKDNRLISITAMNMHSDVFDNVKQFQFYQEVKGEVTFRIVKMNLYTIKDTNYIKRELQKKLGGGFKLIIVFVDKIPRTPRGKQIFLIQKLPINIWSY